jgi:hypothetical protein
MVPNNCFNGAQVTAARDGAALAECLRWELRAPSTIAPSLQVHRQAPDLGGKQLTAELKGRQ